MRHAEGLRWLERLGRVWRLTAVMGALTLSGAGFASEIHDAAQAGEVENLQAILAENPEAVQEVDAAGWTALHLACQFGKVEAVKVLLAAKAEVNLANPKGWTPLLLAVREDRLEIAKLLLAAKADWKAHDPDGNGVLSLAIAQGNPKMVDLLLAAGADLQASDGEGWTPLARAVGAAEPNLPMIQALIDHGAEVNAGSHWRNIDLQERPTSGLNTPLHEAIMNGNLAVVKLLVEHGADIEAISLDPRIRQRPEVVGETPLALAVVQGNKEIAAYLLAQGANVEIGDFMRTRPLQRAVLGNNKALVELLLAHHADPNAKGWEGTTAYSLTQTGRFAEAIDPEIGTLLAKAGGTWIEEVQSDIDAAQMAARRPSYEAAAVTLLKAVSFAQNQYLRKNDFYADSGAALNASGLLIAADVKNAFKQFEGNDDLEKPKAKAGYFFRMLAGQGADKASFRDADNPHLLKSWGAIARPMDKQGVQFFIAEAGTVYKKKDPGDGSFLLEAVPTAAEIEKQGWTVVK